MTSSRSIPKPDHVISGQAYWLDRTEPHRRSDGSELVLDVYVTHCAECGERFEAKAPPGSRKGFNRRCSQHRRPGIWV